MCGKKKKQGTKEEKGENGVNGNASTYAPDKLAVAACN